MDYDKCWVSHPHEWQPLFVKLHERFPESTRLHRWRQYGGQEVMGLTVGSGPNQEPVEVARKGFRLVIAVPHAHEPAPTAAVVNAAHALLTGIYLDGTPSPLPREAILARSIVTFLPDTNSQGRARSPQRVWEGQVDPDTFRKVAFGIDREGNLFGRYPEWRFSKHQPRQVGIEYEQIDEDLYVEPNTSLRSTHTRALDELYRFFRYTHMLDMHQHQHPEVIHLPATYEELDVPGRSAIDAWTERIMQAWTDAGSTPRQPFIPYKGGPRHQYFLEYWRGRCPGMLRLVTEVRNNRLESGSDKGEGAPLHQQFSLALAAVESTLRWPDVVGAPDSC